MRFDSYHPMINLIYFSAVLAFTFRVSHPAFLAIGFACAFVYSVKLNGLRSLLLNVFLLPLGGAYAAWYAYYNHFGITNLRQNFIGNQITLEALAYGGVRAVSLTTAVMLCSCLFAVFTTDKIVYIFGRISPKLSLFFAILLRAVPRVKAEARRMNAAQMGIGRGVSQGNILRRIHHFLRELSILITWMLESFLESTRSMQSRGYSLRGRTAFSIYRFDNRDRCFTVALCSCLIWTGAGDLLDQMRIPYDPRILMNRITPLSYLFYISYAVLFLLPLLVQLFGEQKFRRLQRGERTLL